MDPHFENVWGDGPLGQSCGFHVRRQIFRPSVLFPGCQPIARGDIVQLEIFLLFSSRRQLITTSIKLIDNNSDIWPSKRKRTKGWKAFGPS